MGKPRKKNPVGRPGKIIKEGGLEGGLSSPAGVHPPVKKHPNRLRELRLRGFAPSQYQVALLLGIDNSTVSRDESGDVPMTRTRIAQYSQLYRVPTYEVFLEPQVPIPDGVEPMSDGKSGK